jgi:putative peptidoglycan lipid II flippase
VTDEPAGDAAPAPDRTATTKLPRATADDFQPDVGYGDDTPADRDATAEMSNGTTPMPASGRPPADYGGDPTRESLPFDAPREPAIEAATSDEDVHLIPGATIANGRYRLLVFHGGPPNLQFWQAVDTALDRQVALTFVDPDATLPDEQLQEILGRTLKLSRIDMPGVARVLDVANTGSGGLIVSEWIRGGSLAEVADTSPSPIGGARAMQSLAAAAEAAHRSGVSCSIDHPSRVRVSIEGDVALAFPATMPDATPEDDIRGIGASLYALLVNRWPLDEPGVPSGLRPADLDSAGNPVEPRSVDRDIPFQISAAAAHAIQPDGGIRSAPTLLNLLQQATAIADRTEQINPVDQPGGPQGARPAADDDPEFVARRRKGLMVGLAIGGAILVVALIVLATVLSRIFGDVGGGLDGDELGLNAPSSSEAGESGGGTGTAVKPVRVTVFSPEGEADAPDEAGLAIDGNASTVWPIDTYSDPEPFPNFKNGVGLMLELPRPTTLSAVKIDLNSTGTEVEIRSAESPTPSSLDDTTELTPATPVRPGSNTIEISDAAPTSNVLVWVSKLGQVDGESRSDIAEVTLEAAS